MPRPQIASSVANELDELSRGGGPHSATGANASVRLFSEVDLVRRATQITREYISLQTDVARDGRVAIVTAGSPGAGKTTALRDAGFESAGYREVDADIVKTMLIRRAIVEGTYSHLLARTLPDDRPVRPMELATLIHRESTEIAANVAALSMRRGENVIIQGTLAWEDQPRQLLELLDAHEYEDLVILDIEVNLDTALERVLERWWVARNNPSDALGGRFVPSDLVRGLFVHGPTSVCQANAEVMFSLSDRMSTELRISALVGGVETQTIRRRAGGSRELSPLDTEL